MTFRATISGAAWRAFSTIAKNAGIEGIGTWYSRIMCDPAYTVGRPSLVKFEKNKERQGCGWRHFAEVTIDEATEISELLKRMSDLDIPPAAKLALFRASCNLADQVYREAKGTEGEQQLGDRNYG